MDTQRLENEYQRLLSGLRQQGALPAGAEAEGANGGNPLPMTNDWLANPQVPHDILQEAVSLRSGRPWRWPPPDGKLRGGGSDVLLLSCHRSLEASGEQSTLSISCGGSWSSCAAA